MKMNKRIKNKIMNNQTKIIQMLMELLIIKLIKMMILKNIHIKIALIMVVILITVEVMIQKKKKL